MRSCFAAARLFVVLGVLANGTVAVAAAPNLNRLQGLLSVIHIGELRDGGTLTLALADPQGLGDGVLFNYKHGSATPGRLYADGHPVPPGSAAEARVLAAIQRYLDVQFTPAQQADLAAGTLTAAAHAYGERGYYVCRLLRAVSRLKNFSSSDKIPNQRSRLDHAAFSAVSAVPQFKGAQKEKHNGKFRSESAALYRVQFGRLYCDPGWISGVAEPVFFGGFRL